MEHASYHVRASKNAPNHWFRFRDRLKQSRWRILASPWERETSALQLAERFLALGRESRRYYQRLKQERGAIDFDDILLVAQQAVCPSSTRIEIPEEAMRHQLFLQRLRERYRHILVDEFQDTDPGQWRMLKTISGIGEADRLAGSTVFVVGDDQQAIYGFRGGNVSSFRTAIGELQEAQAKVIELADNYRSSDAVVTAINGFFANVFAQSPDDEEGQSSTPNEQVLKRPMYAKRSENTVGGSILFLPSNLVSSSEVEAEVVAGVVAEKVATHSSIEMAEPHIAVLVRRGQEVRLVAEALQRRGISCQAVGADDFYNRSEIASIELLLRLCADPGDGVALGGVLRSPLFACSDDELALLSLCSLSWQEWLRRGGVGEHVNPDIAATSIACAGDIRRLWQEQSAFSTASSIRHLVSRHGLLEGYERAGMSSAAQHTIRFLDRLRFAELQSEYDGSPQGALGWLLRQYRGARAIPSLATQAHASVIVMTVHSAKGLEYPTVILPFLRWKTRRDHDFLSDVVTDDCGNEHTLFAIRTQDEQHGYSRQETFLSWYLKSLREQEKLREEQRLFYVACTRARDELILLCPSLDGREKPQGSVERGAGGPAKWLKNLKEQNSEMFTHFVERSLDAEHITSLT